jgi:Fe-S-cluster containining protein
MVRPDVPVLHSRNDRCVGLRGLVGCRVACTIYEVRPEACRRFVPGGALCLEAREKFGLNGGEKYVSTDIEQH